ncbi:hypothetical protein C8J98_101384 [Luteibacter sp. OK325]|uniref:hypothetical protein n=1 Tax=Luteibacter sp. OK325 TaxID=2135670 RepID=UPI000D3DBCE0|nr:hypothetical protein [Luteibacter sp. OK325]PTR35121.1 hypothetical protein C8J98_101384 [Luteibacter sp. OK325]
MPIAMRHVLFALIAMTWCACHTVLAQVQPLTGFKPLETYNEVVSCSEKDCKMTPEQFLAVCGAVQLYKVDMPKVKRIAEGEVMTTKAITLPDIGDRNVVAAIRSANLPAGLSPGSWDDWLAIDEDRGEWGIALDRAASSSRWLKLDYSEKCQLASSLLSPFHVEEEVLVKFVRAADGVNPSP